MTTFDAFMVLALLLYSVAMGSLIHLAMSAFCACFDEVQSNFKNKGEELSNE